MTKKLIGHDADQVPVNGFLGDLAYRDVSSLRKADVGLSDVDNVSAADLRDRSTHTGTQTLSTISDAGSIASQDANTVTITGGSIDDTPIGNTTPASAEFTTVTTPTINISNTVCRTETQTVATVSSTEIASFTLAEAGTAKLLVQAKRGTERHLSEVLVAHDGTNVYATEYGVVTTNGLLFDMDVAVSGSNVSITVEGTAATSTDYVTFMTLLEA